MQRYSAVRVYPTSEITLLSPTCIFSADDDDEFGCLTSHLTIFQSYMWRHIDVQADWRRSWTYGRAPNAIDIS